MTKQVIKVAMFSFADINNYGDILFSHIFKMEMEKRIPNLIIDFYCPTSVKIEDFQYMAYDRQKIKSNNYDALVLAGGEVIHFFDERTWKPIYTKNKQEVLTSYPSDVVWDWSDFPSPYTAWISVGVRPFEEAWDQEKINYTIETLNYISVRGTLSKKILENGIMGKNNSKIEITPDLGWLFPALLEFNKSNGAHYKKYIQTEKEYLIFQINNISDDEAKYISSLLVEIQLVNNIKVYLLPVVQPWEDSKYLKKISQFSEGALEVLPADLGIFEVCDIILHSHYVICSSLHTAITALAGGIPAAVINKWQGTKLQDIFGHQFRLKALSHNFEDIPDLFELLKHENLNCKNALISYSEFMNSVLGEMFDSLSNQIMSYEGTK